MIVHVDSLPAIAKHCIRESSVHRERLGPPIGCSRTTGLHDGWNGEPLYERETGVSSPAKRTMLPSL